MPRSTRSNRGASLEARRKCERNSCSYSRAACSVSGLSALILCTCSGFSGALEIIASFAIRKLLSGCVGSTWRSSPKNNCILSQGSCLRSGSLTSSAYKTFGVEPPARQTLKEPPAFAAAFADDEFFRGTLGDCCGILQDSCVGVCAIVGHATPAFA